MSFKLAPLVGAGRKDEIRSFFSILLPQVDLLVVPYQISGGGKVLFSNFSYAQEIFHQKASLDGLKSVLKLGSKLLLPLKSNPAFHNHIFAAPTLYPVNQHFCSSTVRQVKEVQ